MSESKQHANVFRNSSVRVPLGQWEGYSFNHSAAADEIDEVINFSVSQGGHSEMFFEFNSFMDAEVMRLASYVRDRSEGISQHMRSIRVRWQFLSPSTYKELYLDVKQVGLNILDQTSFIESNLNAIREAINTCERCFPIFFNVSSYWESRLKPSSRIPLDELKITDSDKDLIQEVIRRLKVIRDQEEQWREAGLVSNLDRVLGLTETESASGSTETRGLTRGDTIDLTRNLKRKAGKFVKTEAWYYNFLQRAQMAYENDPVGPSDKTSMFISNLNTFLYMANYYSAIPAANLAAERCALSPTASGLLLSMTPLASCLSTLIFSIWSNSSFRGPTQFSSALLIIGNMLYARGLIIGSAFLLYTGRLIVGLGGNRAVNRRYIADFSEVQSRTFYSIVFVSVSGLGMAVGPFIQRLAEGSVGESGIKILGSTYDELSLVPFIFVFLWIVFLLFTFFTFEEPQRFYNNRNSPVFQRLMKEQQSPAFHMDQKLTTSNGDRRLWGAVLCLWTYYILKSVQEAIQSAASIVTETSFGWTSASVSSYLGLLGIVALPTNILTGVAVSLTGDQRTVQLGALLMMTLGLVCQVNLRSFGFNMKLGEAQWILGTCVMFLSAQMLEGVNMGILSSVMPKELGAGMFNSGFLSTEAGTFGRFIGAASISLVGGLISNSNLNNLVVIPAIGICSLTILVVWNFQQYLSVEEMERETERLDVHMIQVFEDFAVTLATTRRHEGSAEEGYAFEVEAPELKLNMSMVLPRPTVSGIQTPTQSPHHRGMIEEGFSEFESANEDSNRASRSDDFRFRSPNC